MYFPITSLQVINIVNEIWGVPGDGQQDHDHHQRPVQQDVEGVEGGVPHGLGPPPLHHLHGVVPGVYGHQALGTCNTASEGSQDDSQVHSEDEREDQEPGEEDGDDDLYRPVIVGPDQADLSRVLRLLPGLSQLLQESVKIIEDSLLHLQPLQNILFKPRLYFPTFVLTFYSDIW